MRLAFLRLTVPSTEALAVQAHDDHAVRQLVGPSTNPGVTTAAAVTVVATTTAATVAPVAAVAAATAVAVTAAPHSHSPIGITGLGLSHSAVFMNHAGIGPRPKTKGRWRSI